MLHFVRSSDSVASLSLLYGVPLDELRVHNRLFADNLLHARHAVRIPGTYYSGSSHSSTPVDGEEEETRKSKTKRFQLQTKCIDPEMAEVYLKEAGWDECLAKERWQADERWASEHPLKGKGRGPAGERAFGRLR